MTMTKHFTPQTVMELRQFVPKRQLKHTLELCDGPEGEFFISKLNELLEIWNNMPSEGETEEQGLEAMAQLHYFGPGDWWVSERPTLDDQVAFGVADLGDRELGVIYTPDLLDWPMVELDYHWTPKSIGEILKQKR